MATRATWLPRCRRLFFVGAGFSAGIGYPVGADLLPRLVEYLRDASRAARRNDVLDNLFRASPEKVALAESLLDRIEEFLARYFAVPSGLRELSRAQLRSLFAEHAPLAELFSVAHALAKMPQLLHGSRRPEELDDSGDSNLFDLLAAAFRSFFLDIGGNNLQPKAVRELLGQLRPDRDVVVCFNWDEEIDYFFTVEARRGASDVSYTRGDWIRRKDTYLLLKPHGSVGWYDVGRNVWNPTIYPVAGRDPRLAGPWTGLVSYLELALPRDAEGRPYGLLDCPPAISPPTFAKDFAPGPQQVIWRDVVDCCATAKSMFFLGYSLPPDDYLTRAAIHRALYSRRNTDGTLQCVVAGKSITDDLRAHYGSIFQGNGVDLRFAKCDFSSKAGLPQGLKKLLRN